MPFSRLSGEFEKTCVQAYDDKNPDSLQRATGAYSSSKSIPLPELTLCYKSCFVAYYVWSAPFFDSGEFEQSISGSVASCHLVGTAWMDFHEIELGVDLLSLRNSES
ncbi:hypothetical protein Tco_0045761 [Tanacetum coccineum]